MTDFLQMLLTWTLTTAIVGTCMLALSQLLRRYISARSEYVSWIAILLLVLLLPIKPAVTPAVTLALPAAQEVSAPVTAQVQATAQPQNEQRKTAAAGDPFYLAVSENETVYPLRQPVRRFTLRSTLPLIFGAVYALGAAILLLLHTLRHVRFMRRIRRWQKPVSNTQTLAMYDQVRSEMGIRRKIPLYLCPAADSPMVAGLVKPRLLLPDEGLSPTELALVLRHELTHVKRHDLFIKALQMLAVCLHWFNPLVHLMNHSMHYACEASCDESVVRGADMNARQYYSETIIAVIRRQSRVRTALSTSFYGGKKGMKNRILTIMDPRVRRMGALLMIPMLLLSLFFTVAVATEPAQTAEPFVSALKKETGDLIDQETAVQMAHSMLREKDHDTREYELSAFEIREITWMDVPVETAVVRMQLKGDPDIIKTAYITARGRVPLEVRQVASYDETKENSRWLDVEYVKTLRSEENIYGTLPQIAYIANPYALSANICEGTTSYTWPQGTYYNGVKVKVLELHTMLNNVLFTNDNTVTWALVQIGESRRSEGVTGWMPLPALTHESKMASAPAALPAAELTTQSDTGYISVYTENNFKSGILTSEPKGTKVSLIGRLRDFYHVELANGQQGFVEIACIKVDDAWSEAVTACEPENYDEVQPGFEEAYYEYMSKIDELWSAYGDSNDWPLEIRAKRTQIQLTYGFECFDGAQMHILPDEKDMTEAQARAIADQKIKDEFGMDGETYYDVKTYFYYFMGHEDVRIWQFRYSAVAGYRDSWVKINSRTGEIIETAQVDYISQYPDPDSESPHTTDDLGYYFEMGFDISNPSEEDKAKEEAAVKAAKDTFCSVYPEHTLLQSFETEATLQHDFMGLKWYLVNIVTEIGDGWMTDFSVIVTLEDEPRIFHTPVDAYRQNIKLMQQDAVIWELEKTKGRFFTWSLEDQAKYRPDTHSLPTEDMITKEEAIVIAREHMLIEIMTEEELKDYQAFPSFTLYNGAEWWIEFYTEEALSSDVLDGYRVTINPITGDVVGVLTPGGNG